MSFGGKNINTNLSFGIGRNRDSALDTPDTVQLDHHRASNFENSVEKTPTIFCFALRPAVAHEFFGSKLWGRSDVVNEKKVSCESLTSVFSVELGSLESRFDSHH